MFRTRSDPPAGLVTLFVRYGIGGVAVIAGIVVLVVDPGGVGVDGFGLLEGAGLSVLMLNWIYRIGVAGDRERDREEDARRYLEEHGHWPGEPPARPRRPVPGARARRDPDRRTPDPRDSDRRTPDPRDPDRRGPDPRDPDRRGPIR